MQNQLIFLELYCMGPALAHHHEPRDRHPTPAALRLAGRRISTQKSLTVTQNSQSESCPRTGPESRFISYPWSCGKSLLSYTLFHSSFVLALDVNSVCDPAFSNHLLVQDWRCGVWDSQFHLVPHGSCVSFHLCCHTLCYWLFGVRASAAHLLSIRLLTPTPEDKGKGKTQSNDLILWL